MFCTAGSSKMAQKRHSWLQGHLLLSLLFWRLSFSPHISLFVAYRQITFLLWMNIIVRMVFYRRSGTLGAVLEGSYTLAASEKIATSILFPYIAHYVKLMLNEREYIHYQYSALLLVLLVDTLLRVYIQDLFPPPNWGRKPFPIILVFGYFQFLVIFQKLSSCISDICTKPLSLWTIRLVVDPKLNGLVRMFHKALILR